MKTKYKIEILKVLASSIIIAIPMISMFGIKIFVVILGVALVGNVIGHVFVELMYILYNMKGGKKKMGETPEENSSEEKKPEEKKEEVSKEKKEETSTEVGQ